MRARYVVVGLAGAAYVAATHWVMTRAPASGWNALVVVGPMLAFATLVAARRGMRLLAVLGAAATLGLVVQAWRGGGLAPNTVYLAQHVGIHLLLAIVFGSTLQAGREPLITALARRVHGRLTASMVAYSRKVTLLWTLYFVAMAMLSIALHRFAPFEAWAVFANLLTPLAMALLFVGEYAVRYRLHPEFERATLGQAMRAYSQRAERPTPGSAPLPHE
ncbi:MAG TPA: hypothetical protein VHM00_01535 [Caldimonas sp.]|jgi:uncharacterized membrane protein|nr:hypothetical protein [Caldimonas sp.]HEX2539742.1 hypothetical protein [Caldimonas sp.]